MSFFTLGVTRAFFDEHLHGSPHAETILGITSESLSTRFFSSDPNTRNEGILSDLYKLLSGFFSKAEFESLRGRDREGAYWIPYGSLFAVSVRFFLNFLLGRKM